MKIALNARFLIHPYTGIGQYTLSLIRGLAKLDHKNEYFLFTPELVELQLPENFRQIRIQEKPFSSASIRKTHWEHTLVPKQMSERGVDLAHFLYPANPWRKLPFPTVVTVHDVIPWIFKEYRQRWRSKIYHFYARQALKKADHIITVSHFTKNELSKRLKYRNDKKISVIYNSLSETKSEQPFQTPFRRDYFLYVGGFDDRKNVPALMEAYQKYISPEKPVDLILVNGKNQELEKYLTNEYAQKITATVHLKNPGKIIFTEPMEREQLNFLYQKALGFVHFSRYEGFNIPLLEALSMGVPAIVSDIPIHHEVAEKAALFVSLKDPDALGKAMQEMIENKGKRQELSRYGKIRAKDFSQKNHAEKTLDVYNLFS